MSDIHSINEAINKRAGRKLFPSIAVSLSLVALVWFALAYRREIFAVVVAMAVLLGIREIVRAFNASGIYISSAGLMIAALALSYATWNGGVAGSAVVKEETKSDAPAEVAAGEPMADWEKEIAATSEPVVEIPAPVEGE